MIHGIVPRKCPTAYCAPSVQGRELSKEDREALAAHHHELGAKDRARSERISKIATARWRGRT